MGNNIWYFHKKGIHLKDLQNKINTPSDTCRNLN
jgi:hypothetical protein